MGSKLLMFSVFILDLIAFGFAVAAELTRSTAKVAVDAQLLYNYCEYDTDIATGLGVGSFVILLISQAILMMGNKCFCCGNSLKSGGSRGCAPTILFMLSWAVFFIEEACLLFGSVRNGNHSKYRTIFGSGDLPLCKTVEKGVFAGGAVLIFINFIVSELYYVSFSNAQSQSPFEAYDKEATVGLITH